MSNHFEKYVRISKNISNEWDSSSCYGMKNARRLTYVVLFVFVYRAAHAKVKARTKCEIAWKLLENYVAKIE